MGGEPLEVVIHIDGGARGNPGPAAAGVVVQSTDDGTVLFEGGYYLGRATNNVAEYRALLKGLERARAMGAGDVEVRSDSELLVRQMNGQYRVKSPGLKPLFEQACREGKGFRRLVFRHVRRELNQHADLLANRALDVGADVEDAAEND